MKILDFGLARRMRRPLLEGECPSTVETVTELTVPGFAAGTIAYMPPEQLESGQVDARGDIYALGLTLYELATGCHPFRGKDAESTIANILAQAAPPIGLHDPGAPAELDRIVQKCLRKRPAERYQSARELLADLKSFRANPAPANSSRNEPQSLLWKLFGPAGPNPYRLWEILRLKACLRCALLVFLAWQFRTDRSGAWSLVLFFSAVLCCAIQTLLSALLVIAGAADRRNLPTYTQRLAPWLRGIGLANGLIAILMAAFVAESHTILAVALTVLGIFVGFTALVLKPAMDRAAIYGVE